MKKKDFMEIFSAGNCWLFLGNNFGGYFQLLADFSDGWIMAFISWRNFFFAVQCTEWDSMWIFCCCGSLLNEFWLLRVQLLTLDTLLGKGVDRDSIYYYRIIIVLNFPTIINIFWKDSKVCQIDPPSREPPLKSHNTRDSRQCLSHGSSSNWPQRR